MSSEEKSWEELEALINSPPEPSPSPTPSTPAPSEGPRRKKTPRPAETENEPVTEKPTRSRASPPTEEEIRKILESSPSVKTVFDKMIEERLNERLNTISKGDLPPEALVKIKDLSEKRKTLSDLLPYGDYWAWLEEKAGSDPASLTAHIPYLIRCMNDDVAKQSPNLVKLTGYIMDKSGKHSERNVPRESIELFSVYLREKYNDPAQDAQFYIDVFEIFRSTLK